MVILQGNGGNEPFSDNPRYGGDTLGKYRVW